MDLSNYLLFSDLDRTLIPNGAQAEAPGSRERLAQTLADTGLSLVYVSGRRLALLQQAIIDYQLPIPIAAIGDVGGSVYRVRDGNWKVDGNWQQTILRDWPAQADRLIIRELSSLSALRLQEPEAQAPVKISYYTPDNIDRDTLLAKIQSLLSSQNIRANLIWSVDEEKRCGLLDVMPPGASKLHAIHYLAQQRGLSLQHCMFSGDSGNDLSVICDGSINSILVNNAPDVVKQEAVRELEAKGKRDKLYIATENYAAGVLQGVEYFVAGG